MNQVQQSTLKPLHCNSDAASKAKNGAFGKHSLSWNKANQTGVERLRPLLFTSSPGSQSSIGNQSERDPMKAASICDGERMLVSENDRF